MTPSLEDIRSAIRGGVEHVKAGVHDGADKIAEAAGSVKGAMTDNVAAATQAVRDAVSGSNDDEDVDDLFASPPTGINTEQVPMPPPGESKEDRLKREKLEKELNDKTRKEIDQSLRMLEGRVDVVGREQKEILTDEVSVRTCLGWPFGPGPCLMACKLVRSAAQSESIAGLQLEPPYPPASPRYRRKPAVRPRPTTSTSQSSTCLSTKTKSPRTRQRKRSPAPRKRPTRGLTACGTGSLPSLIRGSW
jgi:hypothetical protein